MTSCGWSASGDVIITGEAMGLGGDASGVADGASPGGLADTEARWAASGSGKSPSGRAQDCAAAWRGPDLIFTEPTALTSLNSTSLEADPRLSVDSLSLTFASTRAGGLGDFDLYRARRDNPTSGFETFEPIEAINSAYSDTALVVVDDNTVVFSSTRTDGVRARLWTLDLRTPDSATPLELSAEDEHAYDPHIAFDGRLYWTAAPVEGAASRANLRSAQRDDEGLWQPVPIPWDFESEVYDDNLVFSADGSVAVWGSERAGGQGLHDLWFATRPSIDASFGPARAVPLLNGPGHDREGFLSADGCTLTFTSDRPAAAGDWDIYTASVIP